MNKDEIEKARAFYDVRYKDDRTTIEWMAYYKDQETEALKQEVEIRDKEGLKMHKEIQAFRKEITQLKQQLEESKRENERLVNSIDKMFLELGGKWHDNQITITNPALFIKAWKRELLNLKQ